MPSPSVLASRSSWDGDEFFPKTGLIVACGIVISILSFVAFYLVGRKTCCARRARGDDGVVPDHPPRGRFSPVASLSLCERLRSLRGARKSSDATVDLEALPELDFIPFPPPPYASSSSASLGTTGGLGGPEPAPAYTPGRAPPLPPPPAYIYSARRGPVARLARALW